MRFAYALTLGIMAGLAAASVFWSHVQEPELLSPPPYELMFGHLGPPDTTPIPWSHILYSVQNTTFIEKLQIRLNPLDVNFTINKLDTDFSDQPGVSTKVIVIHSAITNNHNDTLVTDNFMLLTTDNTLHVHIDGEPSLEWFPDGMCAVALDMWQGFNGLNRFCFEIPVDGEPHAVLIGHGSGAFAVAPISQTVSICDSDPEFCAPPSSAKRTVNPPSGPCWSDYVDIRVQPRWICDGESPAPPSLDAPAVTLLDASYSISEGNLTLTFNNRDIMMWDRSLMHLHVKNYTITMTDAQFYEIDNIIMFKLFEKPDGINSGDPMTVTILPRSVVVFNTHPSGYNMFVSEPVNIKE